jgi:hypothetical protein
MTVERITVVADGRRVEVVTAEAYDELKSYCTSVLRGLMVALTLLAAEPGALAEKQERPS